MRTVPVKQTNGNFELKMNTISEGGAKKRYGTTLT